MCVPWKFRLHKEMYCTGYEDAEAPNYQIRRLF